MFKPTNFMEETSDNGTMGSVPQVATFSGRTLRLRVCRTDATSDAVAIGALVAFFFLVSLAKGERRRKGDAAESGCHRLPRIHIFIYVPPSS